MFVFILLQFLLLASLANKGDRLDRYGLQMQNVPAQSTEFVQTVIKSVMGLRQALDPVFAAASLVWPATYRNEWGIPN